MALKTKPFPDIPTARRWLMISYRILDAGGAREQEGSIKLYTSRWAFQAPYLMAEILEALDRDPLEFVDARRGRFDFVYSFMQVPHPVSTTDPDWVQWLENSQQTETHNDPKE